MSHPISLPMRRAGAVVAGTLAAAAVPAAILWTPDATANTNGTTIADLVDRTAPAVVTILATPEAPEATGVQMPDMFGEDSPFGEFFRRFGIPEGIPMPGTPGRPMPRGEGVSLGSGFVVEADGYIVTNNHVVENASEITVRFSNDDEFPAEVVGTDPQSDLALLKIEETGLPFLALGDSDSVRVGEDVIAVGNPFGLGGTVTRGIVSALARDINAGPYVDFIQTDAAINRGNSGGPLLDLEGNVIGVNSAIYSPTGGSVGVGFAIPSNTVESVIAQLKATGEVERGWLGVSIQNVTPQIAEALGLETRQGALVADTVRGGPSEGRLEPGDVILAFDGKPVASSRELPKLVSAVRPGEDVEVRVLRDGAETTVTVELGEFEAERQAAAEIEPEAATASDRLGATLAPLTAETRARLGIDEDLDGVVVTSLQTGGRAAGAGLQVGDVILRVAGQEVGSTADVNRAIEEAPADAVLMQIARGEARIFVGVPLA